MDAQATDRVISTYGQGSARNFLNDVAQVHTRGAHASDAALALAIAFGTPDSIETAKIGAARAAYVRGDIEIDEFERQLDEILLAA